VTRQEPVFGYPLMNFNDDKVVSQEKRVKKKLTLAQQNKLNLQKASEPPTKFVTVPQRNLWKLLSEFIFTTTPYEAIEDIIEVKNHNDI
jgi:hypothetical protein